MPSQLSPVGRIGQGPLMLNNIYCEDKTLGRERRFDKLDIHTCGTKVKSKKVLQTTQRKISRTRETSSIGRPGNSFDFENILRNIDL